MNFRSLEENSTASHIRFVTSEVSCFYHDAGTKERFCIKFRCPLSRGCFFSTTPGPLIDNAKCNFENLSNFLKVDLSGKYVLDSEKDLFKSVRNGSIIAIGLDSVEFPYLASIRMSGVLFDSGPTFVAVPVRSESDIVLVPISEHDWNAEDLKVKQLIKNPSEYIQ
jgi:hypothetical protein